MTRHSVEDEVGECAPFGALLDSVDEERSRVACHLHDKVAQILAAISMHLARIGDATYSSKAEEEIRECNRLLNDSICEVRAVSNSLNQPLVAELGLSASLKAFAETWGATNGIALKMSVDLCVEPALRAEGHLAIFRIIRDSADGMALAGAVNVEVVITAASSALRITVSGECGPSPAPLRKSLLWLIIAERASRHRGRARLLESDGRIEIDIMLPREKATWAVAY